MTEHIATRQTETGLVVRRYRYPCGHEAETALVTPPKMCPTCREERWEREREESERRRILAQTRRSAAERAERAHAYGKRHWVCGHCVLSRGVDAAALTEAHAQIFSQVEIKGFVR